MYPQPIIPQRWIDELAKYNRDVSGPLTVTEDGKVYAKNDSYGCTGAFEGVRMSHGYYFLFCPKTGEMTGYISHMGVPGTPGPVKTKKVKHDSSSNDSNTASRSYLSLLHRGRWW